MNIFDKYVSTYDMNDPDINYKYYHSYRVMDNMELIATKLNLSKEDTHLSKTIGLLHDIGRFEQDKLYNSFKDNNFDHGDYGVKVLKENNFLDNFNITKEDYEVVYKAIKNHNKFTIEENLNERELMFSKMIRDADKLDILYALGDKQYKSLLYQDDNNISEKLKESFFNHKLGNKQDVISKNDGLIIPLSFAFDINFKETYQIIYEKDYYNKIYERINRKDIFKEYIDYLNKYLEERIK